MKKISIQAIRNAARVLRVIGHPDRLRIVEALEADAKSVTLLMKELGLPQAVVSKHLAVLKRHGIVRSAAASNFRHYSIAYRNVINVLNCVRTHGGSGK